MGAAEQQQFSQYPLRYGDGTLGAAIAQTRDGKDELITPVALWELDDSSGLYLPPGLSQNPRRPRVDAQLSGSIAERLAVRGLESVLVRRSGPMAAGTDEVLVDLPNVECELEALTLSSNTSLARLRIYPYLSTGNLSPLPLQLPNASGTNTLSVQPGVLQAIGGENDFFINTLYDDQNNNYVLAMKRQARFGNGIQISVGNQAATEKNVAVAGMIWKGRS